MSSVDDENSSTSTSSSSVTMVKPLLLRASMLRPSAFSAQLFSAKPTAEEAVEPSVNTTTAPSDGPAVDAVEKSSSGSLEPAEGHTDKEDESAKEPPTTAEKDKPVEVADPLALLTKSNGLAKSNPFTAVQVTPLASSSGFVFGQNTKDRVTGNSEEEAPASNNGDLSFSTTAVPKAGSGGEGEDPTEAEKEKGDGNGKSLSDVAREYEENKNARKRKFEEVETFTGEEDEINVLDVTCKLYTFAQVYEERGRGSLRLNDPKKGTDSASRLVFRTAGSLRVLLNTKIWDGMIAEPASPKSLRLTAIDTTGQVKVYLVMARPSDIQSLAMALKMRISAEKARVASEVDKTTTTALSNGTVTPDLIADKQINMSDDKEDKAAEGEEVDGEGEEELESLIVEVPAFKRRALDSKDAPVADKETMDEQTIATATENTPEESAMAD